MLSARVQESGQLGQLIRGCFGLIAWRKSEFRSEWRERGL